MKIMQEDLCWVYITFSSKKEARFIGKILVKQNLVACVNILGEMISIFKWEGKISEDKEVAIIAKTRKELMPKIIKTVSKNHSYECPCILELPIQGGNPKFLKWIETETELIKNN